MPTQVAQLPARQLSGRFMPCSSATSSMLAFAETLNVRSRFLFGLTSLTLNSPAALAGFPLNKGFLSTMVEANVADPIRRN